MERERFGQGEAQGANVPAAREQKQISKTEALREAQEALLTGTVRPSNGDENGRGVTPMGEGAKPAQRWSQPYYWDYWAPFILIGN